MKKCKEHIEAMLSCVKKDRVNDFYSILGSYTSEVCEYTLDEFIKELNTRANDDNNTTSIDNFFETHGKM